jgi:tryptophan 7-halogenase
MNNNPEKKQRLVIAGGGTAGWMTAAAMAKLMGKNLSITLIESDEISTVGVGEATIPTLHIFHQLLGIKENEVMAATNATFKLGIMFENWKEKNQQYLHSFGFLGADTWSAQFHHYWLKGEQKGFVQPLGDYCTEHLAAREKRFAVYPNQALNHAYHMDASLYAKFLRKFAESYGVKRLEGKIGEVQLHEKDGSIAALALTSGEIIQGDIFIDCTGFSALLIEKALHTGFEDWSHWLPCDKAIAVQTETVGEPLPYTRSIAHDFGWQWKIPLQTRTGNGFVYCSKYMSDQQALALLTDNIEGKPLTEPRFISFRTGVRRKQWNKNCVAIGLSSGFIEPLESTSIHLIQKSIIQLLLLFPSAGIIDANVNEFNATIRNQLENIRDFIVLHYHVTEREDTQFWRYCKNMDVPQSLRHRLALFGQDAQIYKYEGDLFGHSSWVQVLLGQGRAPKKYHPSVDLLSDEELQAFLNRVKVGVYKAVLEMPNHLEFIARYCKAAIVPSQALLTSDAIEINKSAPVIVKALGESKTALIVADNFLAAGLGGLREHAKSILFAVDEHHYYPGLRSALPQDYLAKVLSAVAPMLQDIYAIPKNLTLKVMQADYSLITQPQSLLTENQCVPHADTSHPYAFAILHYLSAGAHGGTGFFKHIPSGYEVVSEENSAAYYAAKEEYFVKNGRPHKSYMTSSNNHYQLYDAIPYQENKLLVYPGVLLHSVLVNAEQDISLDPETGRLTANIFVKFE